MMLHSNGGKRSCSLLVVVYEHKNFFELETFETFDRKMHPIPELTSSSRLEVKTLTNPSLEEFQRTLESLRPDVVYLQGELITRDGICGLVWDGVHLSNDDAVPELFGHVLPSTVHLEIPNGEHLADDIHAKYTLLSVLQSSPCHVGVWGVFQLAHAPFGLYLIRNNSVLPINTEESGVNLGPSLLREASNIDVVIPEADDGEEEDESSGANLSAVKIHDDMRVSKLESHFRAILSNLWSIGEQHVSLRKPMETNLCIRPNDQQQPPPSDIFANIGILPEDLLVEVLSRLRVRHLLRLRCVSKSWCTLIDDVYFNMRHYQFHHSMHKINGDIPRVGTTALYEFLNPHFLVSLISRQQDDDVFLDLTADFVRDTAECLISPHLSIRTHCIGVVNGVVCFLFQYMDYGLWNPATREFKPVVPPYHPDGFSCLLTGFGFDDVSNDFKILQRSPHFDSERTFVYDIYSLSSNTWKRIKEPPFIVDPVTTTFMQAYLNGVCYWNAYYSKIRGDDLSSLNLQGILSLNLRTEVLEIIDLPEGAVVRTDWEYSLVVTEYMESLAFVVRTDLEQTGSSFEIWVVTKFHDDSGIPVSWQRMFTIGPLPSPGELSLSSFRMNGDVVFNIGPECIGTESSLYNPSTGTFKNLGMSYGSFHGHVESLLPLSKRLVWN